MEKDHLEIILEDIKEKFDLVLEGHQTLRHEIQDMHQEMNERFELADFKIDALNRKIDDVDSRLSKKIDDVDAKLSKKIDEVDSRLSKKIDDLDAKLSGKIDGVASESRGSSRRYGKPPQGISGFRVTALLLSF